MALWFLLLSQALRGDLAMRSPVSVGRVVQATEVRSARGERADYGQTSVRLEGQRMADDLIALLEQSRIVIINEAEEALARSKPRHYVAAGAAEMEVRLTRLFDCLRQALADRDLTPMVDYARAIAKERFESGYDLSEVQTAFNALEEAVWARILEELPPERLGEALGLVSTILGSGKDALARSYVSLAAHTHTASLDLRSLFKGTEGA